MSPKTWAMFAGAALLFLAALFLLTRSHSDDIGPVAQIESALISTLPPPTTRPAEAASSTSTVATPESDLWTVNEASLLTDLAPAGESPRPTILRIPTLGVVARIDGYGINERTGQMDVPRNVRDVAWYQHGPAPGEPGSAVLAAHVDLQGQGPGVFFNLKNMLPGDVIEVEFDNGVFRAFEVQARATYEKDELPLDAVFSRQGGPVLTLITCGGGFDRSSASYDSNVVVYAAAVRPEHPNLGPDASSQPRTGQLALGENKT